MPELKWKRGKRGTYFLYAANDSVRWLATIRSATLDTAGRVYCWTAGNAEGWCCYLSTAKAAAVRGCAAQLRVRQFPEALHV